MCVGTRGPEPFHRGGCDRAGLVSRCQKPPAARLEATPQFLCQAGELGELRDRLVRTRASGCTVPWPDRCRPCGGAARSRDRIAPTRRPAPPGVPVPACRPGAWSITCSSAIRSSSARPSWAANQARSASTSAGEKPFGGQVRERVGVPRRSNRRPAPTGAGRARRRDRQGAASDRRPATGPRRKSVPEARRG